MAKARKAPLPEKAPPIEAYEPPITGPGASSDTVKQPGDLSDG